jgi:predicted nucleic acid-binding protein
MGATEPYNGLTVLVDSCVFVKLHRAPRASRQEFAEALTLNRLRVSPVVVLEILYGMRTPEAIRQQQEFFDQFPKADLRRTIGWRAIQALGELAELHPDSHGYHRVKWADLLIAATAEHHGFGVIHHDADFDKIRQVVDCKPIWFADRDEANWEPP